LLILFYKNRKSLGSGLVTALSNRVGDCFFLLLLGVCQDRRMALLFLFFLSMTKRAQIPFTSWLPAAMAAPTPVSALVHSSTLVTAGVYMLFRFSYQMEGLLGLGVLTMLFAGFRACSERDMKKVVALRTLSQLGVLFVSIGLMAKSYCFFHLLSHACFKALLFICMGTLIHINYGSQDFRSVSFLNINTLISVFSLFSVSSLSGFLYTAGFYTKDQILVSTYTGSLCIRILFLFGIGLTTYYSFRIVMMFTVRGEQPTSICKDGILYRTVPLGLLRLTIGNQNEGLDIQVGITSLTPILCILGGICLGKFHLYYPLFNSLFTITPLTQSLSDKSLSSLQYHTDKG